MILTSSKIKESKVQRAQRKSKGKTIKGKSQDLPDHILDNNGCVGPIKRLCALQKTSKNIYDKKFNKGIKTLKLEN